MPPQLNWPPPEGSSFHSGLHSLPPGPISSAAFSSHRAIQFLVYLFVPCWLLPHLHTDPA